MPASRLTGGLLLFQAVAAHEIIPYEFVKEKLIMLGRAELQSPGHPRVSFPHINVVLSCAHASYFANITDSRRIEVSDVT